MKEGVEVLAVIWWGRRAQKHSQQPPCRLTQGHVVRNLPCTIGLAKLVKVQQSIVASSAHSSSLRIITPLLNVEEHNGTKNPSKQGPNDAIYAENEIAPGAPYFDFVPEGSKIDGTV